MKLAAAGALRYLRRYAIHRSLRRIAPGDFPTTQWSLVLAAGDREAAAGNHALAELCRAYWRPLYTFVRRRGYPEEEAKDLTQDFFVMLLERDVIARVDRERGRFRTFLLVTLRNFLADQHDRNTALKRGGGAAHISFDEHGRGDHDVAALPPSVRRSLFRHGVGAHARATGARSSA